MCRSSKVWCENKCLFRVKKKKKKEIASIFVVVNLPICFALTFWITMPISGVQRCVLISGSSTGH